MSDTITFRYKNYKVLTITENYLISNIYKLKDMNIYFLEFIFLLLNQNEFGRSVATLFDDETDYLS